MFESLIRRRFAARGPTTSDVAFESTTVSLSTAVPRPLERRGDERVTAMLRVAKLSDADGNQQLVKIKNLSAGGYTLRAQVMSTSTVKSQAEQEIMVTGDGTDRGGW